MRQRIRSSRLSDLLFLVPKSPNSSHRRQSRVVVKGVRSTAPDSERNSQGRECSGRGRPQKRTFRVFLQMRPSKTDVGPELAERTQQRQRLLSSMFFFAWPAQTLAVRRGKRAVQPASCRHCRREAMVNLRKRRFGGSFSVFREFRFGRFRDWKAEKRLQGISRPL